MKGVTLCILASLFLVQAAVSYEPNECKKKSDCGPNECCLVGMEKYSIPQCSSMGKTGDWCRTNAVAEDRRLYYPNGIFRDVENSYSLFCPCAKGYTCKRNKCQPSKG
ncbi:Astakine, partial [Stegodyphus mimosarum]